MPADISDNEDTIMGLTNLNKYIDRLKVKNNVFIRNLPKMINSKIIFNGKNNILSN